MGHYQLAVELGAEVDPLDAEAIENKLDLLLTPYAEWRYAIPYSDEPYKTNPDERFDARAMAYHRPSKGESKSYRKIMAGRFAILGSVPVESAPGSILTCEVIYKKDFKPRDLTAWSFVDAAGQWFEFGEKNFTAWLTNLSEEAVLVLVGYHE